MTGRAEAEAAVWFARLGDDARSPEGHCGLASWRGERPANAAALAEMEALWSDLEHVAALSFYSSGVAAARAADPQRGGEGGRAGSGLTRARTWPVAAGIAAAVATLMLVFAWHLRITSPTIFETPVGGRQVASLPDASRVTLNTNSRLSARFTGSERLIMLDRGEALFEVSKDPDRPFVVQTRLGRVTALGTKFVVRDWQDVMEVTLLSGSVLVDPQKSGQASFIMAPGQRVRLGVTGSATVDKPSLPAVTAWRDGRLILQDMSAVAAVREMNRYGRKPITLDPSVSTEQCQVSGVFRVADTERFANSLARICGLRLVRLDDRYLIEP
ncbi:FecR family protein [Pelagerythrobacter rhizovicinus]|uniref:FecR family protein n=1 Tax=Pelagerythrobacter rhizovicinus TaxID=2268576 RepID=UPI0013EE257C|nr:FecR domain-containing protein [Pelagerythrobacter rhizovicinus]